MSRPARRTAAAPAPAAAPANPGRVLFFSVFHPELVRGGAQQAAYELFLGAKAAGWDAIFLASVEPNIDQALFKPGAIFTGFDNRPDEFLFLSDSFEHNWYRNLNIRALRWFEEFLRDRRPDVIHFHHFMTIGLDLFLVARRVLPDARIILTLHEFLGICKADGHMVRRNEAALCRRASAVRCHQCFPAITPETFSLREAWVKHAFGAIDAFVTPTEFIRTRYIEWGLPAERIHAIANAQADYAAGQPPAATIATPHRFGFFGQLIDAKGLGVVFDALEHYARTWTTPIRLEINGANLHYASEAFRTRFEGFLADAKAMEPVVTTAFNGSYAMADLPARMGRVDWVLVPSIWWEAFGLVVSEAFMFRRPPIATNLGGLAERIEHDRTGLLFEAGDPIALAETLHRCVSEAGLHARLAAASPGVAAVADVLAQHAAVYKVGTLSPP